MKLTEEYVKAFKVFTDGLFRKFLGLVLVIGGGSFLWKAAFGMGEGENYTEAVVGFIMGSVITIVVNFYYSSSQGSSEKAKTIDQLIKEEVNE